MCKSIKQYHIYYKENATLTPTFYTHFLHPPRGNTYITYFSFSFFFFLYFFFPFPSSDGFFLSVTATVRNRRSWVERRGGSGTEDGWEGRERRMAGFSGVKGRERRRAEGGRDAWVPATGRSGWSARRAEGGRRSGRPATLGFRLDAWVPVGCVFSGRTRGLLPWDARVPAGRVVSGVSGRTRGLLPWDARVPAGRVVSGVSSHAGYMVSGSPCSFRSPLLFSSFFSHFCSPMPVCGVGVATLRCKKWV
jgi:hypothetical protein